MVKMICSLLGIGYYSTTSMRDLSNKEVKKIVKLTLRYCEQNLGVNRRKSTPLSLVMCDNPYDECYLGEYDPVDNQINIFTDEIGSLGALTSTIVHEYTHYLQPILTKYAKMLDEYGYDKHPYEVEARDNERIHNRRVLAYIRENM